MNAVLNPVQPASRIDEVRDILRGVGGVAPYNTIKDRLQYFPGTDKEVIACLDELVGKHEAERVVIPGQRTLYEYVAGGPPIIAKRVSAIPSKKSVVPPKSASPTGQAARTIAPPAAAIEPAANGASRGAAAPTILDSILALLADGQPRNADAITRAIGRHKASVGQGLCKLKREGKVRMVGKGHDTTWTLNTQGTVNAMPAPSEKRPKPAERSLAVQNDDEIEAALERLRSKVQRPEVKDLSTKLGALHGLAKIVETSIAEVLISIAGDLEAVSGGGSA